MATFTTSLSTPVDRAAPHARDNLWRKLERILDHRVQDAADDVVFLSAFDEATLRSHGYSERQIDLIKDARALLV